ncbi:glycoside hydrolase family 13 protein [Mesobacillus selenatarsenatis]|uniref:oligo-1,6-glucosidase n=1 Tax=Mesobacillus selenatarsenatis (strain DSM 18680 / JCM 14380 / FERM P-15431 / SF-1) TaxID=1321606 RepID=A0A0A8X3C7_MESS1|nr:alpha-glucosidase [Mesobacillus selenatarsenatis]GAM13537.1 oligo-1,6-glucosidase [Mesobacillus selenatarsenatis SF-1]
MKKHWWKESVIYQIYPRSFMDSNGDGIGDIPGIISKLDYLKDLGIDVIWLSPVYKSPNDDNGYDISDYRDIMDDFGTMADWELLLKEMHDRGLKLIMDLVVNHSSDEHEWFVESRKSKDNPYRDYYIWRPGKDGKEPNNWQSTFSGSAWQFDENTGEYYLHIFSKKQPDLNWENPKLRQEVHEMMKFWLDKGIDGFRMDVINFISKVDGLPDAPNPEGKKYVSGSRYFMNGPKIHDYLQEMHREALAQYDVMTVGEMPGANVEEAKLYTDDSRNELNMVFQFEHVDLDSGPGGKWDLKPLKLTDLKNNFTKWQKGLEDIGWNSLYLNNHDQPRMVSRFGDDKEYRVESAKMLGTFLHMLKGTPYIYQGEEIGMTNVRFDSIEDYKDIETLNMYNEKVNQNGENPAKVMESIYVKGRDNARTPFQWDDSEHGGFTTGTPWLQVNPNYTAINAEQAVEDESSIFHYYRKLIQLRKEHPVIVHGSYDILVPEDESIYVYTRTLESQKLLVLLNFTNEDQSFDIPADLQGKKNEILISNYEANTEYGSAISLKPYEAIVYLIQD